MKLTRCIQKNIRILLRSKGSALVVLLAPLIIVFIIGLGFMDNPDLKLNIGTYVTEPSTLTTRYIDSFNTTGNNVITYAAQQDCVNSIREGVTVMCIVFSEDFEIRDGAKNELTFYVDESRINLVDRLISSLSTTLGTESSDISEELTEQLIRIIEVSNKEAQDTLALIISNRAQLTNVNNQASTAKTSISGMDTTTETINSQILIKKVEDIDKDFNNIKTNAQNIVTRAQSINFDGANQSLIELRNSINTLNTTLTNSNSTRDLEELTRSINTVATSMNKLRERIESAGDVKASVTSNLDSMQAAINTITQNTDNIKTKQEQILSEIEAFEIRSARSIASPINTKIQSVASTNTRLTYSFSYLLTLAILFIGLMLSSTLVFMEKDSKSYFRNFTTPTTYTYFTFVNYLTAVFILIIQTLIILGIAHFTLSVPILSNIYVTSTFLFLGITLFITLGILIGMLSSTSEAVTMGTLIIGSVLLFLSNLILPLETLSPIMSKVATFNPYVIMSEGIRKAMLFNATFQETAPEIIMLVSYIVIVIAVMIIINQVGFKHYLATRRHKKNLHITEPDNLILDVKDDVKVIRNESELLTLLKTMSQEDYQKVTKPKNQITEWLKNKLKQKSLARKLKNKNLVDAIKILEDNLEKENKKTK